MTKEYDNAIELLEHLATSGGVLKGYVDAIRVAVAAIRRLQKIERVNDMPLSQRLDDKINCDQWIIDEVIILEQAVAELEAERAS